MVNIDDELDPPQATLACASAGADRPIDGREAFEIVEEPLKVVRFWRGGKG